ncbi:MAG TPA: polyhydroxyalkanoate depolymerase [Burkholderiaceae bacterium]|nr:polyhydroxyalkanoate depolymerase [Burkholderiaceae bacterium]
MIYQTYQSFTDLMWPFRTMAQAALPVLAGGGSGPGEIASVRRLSAELEVFALGTLTHQRPSFGLDTVTSGGVEVSVTEEAVLTLPFGTLLRFRKQENGLARPRVLVVAPMSGHFATLLRETVRTLMADHDVYITDWHNARSVPMMHGDFGLDEYIDYVMQFLRAMGPGAHLLAVCQPCVAALAAAAVMAQDADPAAPISVTLMAGPVDCRVSPTDVNRLAVERPIEWFSQNLIGVVPLRYPGALRRVYPGFMQLTAFMSMNLNRHLNAFAQLYRDRVGGDHDKVDATRAFYEEYFAVADLPAEFYLETVQKVFQEYALARGHLRWRDRIVQPAAMRRTALLTVEGERDDICGIGQTLAAQELCTSIKPWLRTHYVQPGAGHYGVFSGRRWSQHIYPVVRETIQIAESTFGAN